MTAAPFWQTRLWADAVIGMSVVDADGRYVHVNPALCTLFGRPAADIVGRRTAELTHPDDVARSQQSITSRTTLETLQKRFVRPDGEVVHALRLGRFVPAVEGEGPDGEQVWLIQYIDVTAWVRRQDGLLSLSRHAVSGGSPEQLLDQARGLVAELLSVDAPTAAALLAPATWGQRQEVGTASDAASGTGGADPRSSDERAVVDHVAATLELARGRWDGEEELRRRALTDALTGLVSRAGLAEIVHDLALVPGTPSDRTDAPGTGAAGLRHLSVVLLDLDGFKHVNDSLGHGQGDALLVQIAQRLDACGRDERRRGARTWVGRLGGDEFLVLVEGEHAAGHRLAERAVAAARRPVELPGGRCTVGASAGLVSGADPRRGLDPLVADADLALYEAKRSGRGRVVTFHDRMRADKERSDLLAHDLRRALLDTVAETGRITTAVESVRDLATGRLLGLEVLARWRHPVAGDVPARTFVALAEDAGLGPLLGSRVLAEALARLAGEVGQEPPSVSVNLSALQLRDPGCADLIAEGLARAGAAPQRLTLEVTERVIDAVEHAGSDGMQTLRRLRELGCRIALDDVGEGPSSLTMLTRVPLDAVKLDPYVVEDLDAPSGRAVARAVVAAARELGLDVVAEGISDLDVVPVLLELGIHAGQGRAVDLLAP
ncbi:MAG: EAL domain-containing protein [Kineosporiaceae bacterium]